MSKNLSIILQLTLAMMFWGLGTVLTKSSLGSFDSWVLLPIQLTCSLIFLGMLLLLLHKKELSIRSRPSYFKLSLLGVLNPGIAYALALSGLARIPASTSVVIWAMEPLLIAVLAFLFIKGTIKRETVLAMILASSGVLMIIGKPSGRNEILGVFLTLSAVSACAGYSVILSVMKLNDASLYIVFLQQLAAVIFAFFLMFAKFIYSGPPVMDISPWKMIEAAIGGITYYGLAFWLYVSGLRRTSAMYAGTFLTLIPVFGLIFSAYLLGEQINQQEYLGALIVIGAVASLSLVDQRRRIAN